MASSPFSPRLDIRRFYEGFAAPVTELDCGQKCAPYNASGKPFCCDICHAVPVAFRQEWDYLRPRTDLWHAWRGDECACEPVDPLTLQEQTPEHLTLLACLGPEHCQREFRASSCREFPFFPYITADDRFIGLAYEWEFEEKCWVISNLGCVTSAYRAEFIRTYDVLFEKWPDEYESYYATSEEMRAFFAEKRRRIPILHRNGGFYLLSPGSERLTRVDPSAYRRFGVYKEEFTTETRRTRRREI
ncbi:hypothetical protein [Longilinea arvoryzae]|uniref:hypothetical protein n=1 Tax=Longilinea arvoryzae TaxID=360412 RepID=UPI00126034D6|nr:hypothetical protein [Longilinea arvoryzae]